MKTHKVKKTIHDKNVIDLYDTIILFSTFKF